MTTGPLDSLSGPMPYRVSGPFRTGRMAIDKGQTMTSYSEMSAAVDAWAGYWGRGGDAQRSVSAALLDTWGRLPEPITAKRAADRVRQYHGGKPDTCSRAAALVGILDKIAAS